MPVTTLRLGLFGFVTAAALGLLASDATFGAPSPGDMSRCRAIESAAARLQCYENLSTQLPPVAQPEMPAQPGGQAIPAKQALASSAPVSSRAALGAPFLTTGRRCCRRGTQYLLRPPDRLP